MKITTLQLAAELGQFKKNVERADDLLKSVTADDVDLLVLPELAFSGYNFPSLEAIQPFLEPTAAGPSTEWAKQTATKLQCIVIVGYPEIATSPHVNGTVNTPNEAEANTVHTNKAKRYNSTVTVSPTGTVIAHYRKAFLYYTDDTWANEGTGFYSGLLPLSPPLSPTSTEKTCRMVHGICMDINPYKFTSPWEAYEFTNHMLDYKAEMAVMSNAWLTAAPSEGEAAAVPDEDLGQPDLRTLGYWIERFGLLRDQQEKEFVVVCANRTGREGNAVYAGTSTVMKIGRGKVALWGILGWGVEDVLRVDTSEEPPLRLVSKTKEDDPAPSQTNMND